MKKAILSLVAIIIIGGAFIIIKNSYSTISPGMDYDYEKLTPDKLITDESIIDSIMNKGISPKGNKITKVVIYESPPGVIDESGVYAFYTCSVNEREGWYYVHAAEGPYPNGYAFYGPYDWCLQ